MKVKLLFKKNGDIVDECFSNIHPVKDDTLYLRGMHYKVVHRQLFIESNSIILSVIEI